MTISNRPEALREFDRLHSIITGIAETRMFTAVVDATQAATEITALAYLMLIEGQKPSCVRFFMDEIATKKGDSTTKKLVNYALDGSPSEIRRIVVEYRNQMVASIEMLLSVWHPPVDLTKTVVLAEIAKLGGIENLRQRWMNVLADKARTIAEQNRIGMARREKERLEEQAGFLGMTVEAYVLHVEKEKAEAKASRAASRMASVFKNGTDVKMPKDYKVFPGAIIMEHEGRMIELQPHWAEEIRAILMIGCGNEDWVTERYS